MIGKGPRVNEILFVLSFIIKVVSNFQVNLGPGEEFQTEDGDLIGWTNTQQLVPFACEYTDRDELYYNDYVDALPSLQSTHSFGSGRGLAINCSIGVEVVPSKAFIFRKNIN